MAFNLIDRHVSEENHRPAEAGQQLAARMLPAAVTEFSASAPKYQLNEALETALNMALCVGAPLLLTGEPGTGKTQVAWYLKWYFNINLYGYQVRSTSTADDMKYDFDAIGYLRAAQSQDKTKSRGDFLDKKALWQAYDDSMESVVLIDEIDKAPRDFPNDLLQELDKHCFKHPFEDHMIKPTCTRPPIVIITSNGERRLPDAFLRRCIAHYIELDEGLIKAAVRARAGDFPRLDESTQDVAMSRFWDLRDREMLRKKPSTAELLMWLTILSAKRVDRETLRTAKLNQLPYLSALIKDHDDMKRL